MSSFTLDRCRWTLEFQRNMLVEMRWRDAKYSTCPVEQVWIYLNEAWSRAVKDVDRDPRQVPQATVAMLVTKQVGIPDRADPGVWTHARAFCRLLLRTHQSHTEAYEALQRCFEFPLERFNLDWLTTHRLVAERNAGRISDTELDALFASNNMRMDAVRQGIISF